MVNIHTPKFDNNTIISIIKMYYTKLELLNTNLKCRTFVRHMTYSISCRLLDSIYQFFVKKIYNTTTIGEFLFDPVEFK